MANKYEIIKNWVENVADNDDIVGLVSSADSWNGSLWDYVFYDMSSLNEFYGGCKVTDFLEKLAPNFNVSSDGYRDTYYGLESCSIEEAVADIKDNIDDIVDSIIEAMDNMDMWLPSELEEALEEAEEE